MSDRSAMRDSPATGDRPATARRGTPVVLRVDVAGMHRAGHAFYRAANGVWLTASVPPEWIDADKG
jgi:RNA:NAD 2'-phosphotransferase (TPT1/KptA family)